MAGSRSSSSGPSGAKASTETPTDLATGSTFPAFGILQGATLAFYAFIGFEDMVNVVEEVERPREHLPVAIVLALLTVGLTYVAVSALATLAVSPAELEEAAAPLHLVVRTGIPAFPDVAFTFIAIFAVANTALLNFVMASRLAYGMADEQELMPGWLGAVHEGRGTPQRAVVVIGLLAPALALSGTLETLAATTSLLLLAVFFLMNLSYLVVKRREGSAPDAFSIPTFVPVLGMVLSVGLAAFVSWQSMAAVAGVVGAGGLVLGLLKLRS